MSEAAPPVARRVLVSLLQDYWIPERCGLRLHLRHRGLPEGEPDPFLRALAILGDRHETRVREELAPYVDLGHGDAERRREETLARLGAGGDRPLYQPLLVAPVALAGHERLLVGNPDFLLPEGDGWSVLEIKLARNVDERRHAEIFLQIQAYGWLLERALGRAPAALRVIRGDGERVELPYDGGGAALAALDRALRASEAEDYGYEPVGWSKCQPCTYRAECWEPAERRRDAAILPGVDQGLARALRPLGVATIPDLLARYEGAPESLAALERPWGNGVQKVGERKATAVLTAARAYREGAPIRLAPLALPEAPSFAVLDIEGIPPDLDDPLGQIFLWGLKRFGERPGEYRDAVAGFDEAGDREAWEGFLAHAHALFESEGEGLRFVHWSHYERTKLAGYRERFGDDRHRTAERVSAALLDLLPVLQKSWALPLPSYGLKKVEEFVGFRRRLANVNGAWAVAEFIGATEARDEDKRRETLDRIRLYNEEDLDATWAVLCWLLEQDGRPVPGAAA